jgi:hypothetical protein
MYLDIIKNQVKKAHDLDETEAYNVEFIPYYK